MLSFRSKHSILLIFFLLIIISPSVVAEVVQTTTEKEISFWSDYPADELSDLIISQMTDEELLSQIFMFGWASSEPTPLLNSWVIDRGLGSVKIFGWNTDDISLVAKSVIELQQKAQNRRFSIPLFVATDQEGGWIRHVKGNTSDTPGNLAIGASGYPIDAYYTGYYISQEMRSLGINLNFAPTIDLYTSKDSSVIGPRSFGENSDYVGIFGSEFVRGSLDSGVIPTAKHFPGHGDTSSDSHGTLPVINIDLETLYSRELIPFEYLIKQKIPAIMSGHLSFPRIDPSGKPASLSSFFLKDILRKKLGFEGLIITDDMMMNGATLFAGSISAAFRMAIEAGNDIIISSNTPQLNEALWRNNIELMKTDSEFRQNVVNAAKHILKVKLEYFKGDNPVPIYPDLDAIDSLIPAKNAPEFFLQQACRSITLFKKGMFPYTSEMALKEKVLLAGQFFSYGDEMIKRYPEAKFFSYKYNMTKENLKQYKEELSKLAKNYDTIIFCVANAESAELIDTLRDSGKRVILISILAPKFVLNLDWVDTIILAYSYSSYSFKAAAAVLAGEIEPVGELPLTIK